MEQKMVAIGMEVLQQTLTWPVEGVDAELAQARQHQMEACCVAFEGKKALTIATVLEGVFISGVNCVAVRPVGGLHVIESPSAQAPSTGEPPGLGGIDVSVCPDGPL